MLDTLPEDFDSVLLVMAHPDDPEYGSAAAVARWLAEGKRVGYVLASRGEAGIAGLPPADSARIREAEQRAACAAIGVEHLVFLDEPDGSIMYTRELRTAIAEEIRRFRPEVVMVLNFHETFGGRHPNSADHRHVGLAALDAVSDAGNEWIVPGERYQGVKYILEFAGEPTHVVDVDGHVDAAVTSLMAHERYLQALSDAPVEEQARAQIERATAVEGFDTPHIAVRLYG
ncbi:MULTISPECIES: PIG-L deacetylase family protein [Brevibacterium]|uniref:PIG-L family deacetylase n=1 Tax=Brevibacterium pityocampae TaxID=506594 RepID=A0ABP8JDG3_9MICO|nr:PIG-L deacetylase family protein [Brevibacterium sp. CS2]QCP05780.1 PIG-L family deacetylase [Brevibacterium sp. CS2]